MLLPCMEKGEGGKVGGGTRCRGGVRATVVGEGGGVGCVAAAVVGSAHAPLSSNGRGRAKREREARDNGCC